MQSETDHLPAALLWVAEFGDRPPLFLVKALLDTGMSLTTVQSSEDVFNPASMHQKPDLILLSMTDWSATAGVFCQLLQDQLGRSAPPIIVMALPQTEPDFEVAFALGVYDYLIRPVPWPLLRQRLQHAIEYHRALLQTAHLSGHGESLKYQLTQTKQRLAQAQHQDLVTQLLNRTAFEDAFALAWRLHTREKKALSLVLIDLGYRDAVWDDVASAITMDYLHRLGAMILDHLKRPGDLACRYQEKQLLVLLPNTTLAGATEWMQILETSWNLEQATASTLHRNLHPIWHQGISSHQPTHGDESENLIVSAMQSLQRAQEQSRTIEPQLPAGA